MAGDTQTRKLCYRISSKARPVKIIHLKTLPSIFMKMNLFQSFWHLAPRFIDRTFVCRTANYCFLRDYCKLSVSLKSPLHSHRASNERHHVTTETSTDFCTFIYSIWSNSIKSPRIHTFNTCSSKAADLISKQEGRKSGGFRYFCVYETDHPFLYMQIQKLSPTDFRWLRWIWNRSVSYIRCQSTWTGPGVGQAWARSGPEAAAVCGAGQHWAPVSLWGVLCSEARSSSRIHFSFSLACQRAQWAHCSY